MTRLLRLIVHVCNASDLQRRLKGSDIKLTAGLVEGLHMQLCLDHFIY